MTYNAIMIFGPTASGKTGLAIELAKSLNGVVINADSRQIYKHMPIITAMPSAEEFAAAPHELFDFLEPSAPFSVTDYLEAARGVAAEVVAQGKVPIFCGGTGFYLKVLEEGISPIPDVDDTIVQKLVASEKEEGIEDLYKALQIVDPELAATLKPADSQRIMRGLAVFEQTGKKLSGFQKEAKENSLGLNFLKIAIDRPREETYDRINQRFELMMQEGLEEELRALKEQGYTTDMPALTSLGIPEFYSYLEGDMPLEKVAELIKQQTRRYAKRQYTWLRHQFKADVLLHEISSAKVQELLQQVQEKFNN